MLGSSTHNSIAVETAPPQLKLLREDGHMVDHAYDVLSPVQLAQELPSCDSVISNTKVEGTDGVGLIRRLRQDRPDVPII